MREFEGKIAVVTGAASGMGRAFAERFARAGMHVVLADIEEEALKTAVRELEQEEHRVIGVVTNTMSRDSVQALARRAIDEFGKVHIVCNNAGVTSRGDAGAAGRRGVWEIPQSDWDWLLGVNFWGVLYGLQVFIPHMLEHGEEGHIVNTASLAGLIPGGGAYGVTKHGVLALSEGLYRDLKARDARIGASVLCPGFVNTGRAQTPRSGRLCSARGSSTRASSKPSATAPRSSRAAYPSPTPAPEPTSTRCCSTPSSPRRSPRSSSRLFRATVSTSCPIPPGTRSSAAASSTSSPARLRSCWTSTTSRAEPPPARASDALTREPGPQQAHTASAAARTMN